MHPFTTRAPTSCASGSMRILLNFPFIAIRNDIYKWHKIHGNICRTCLFSGFDQFRFQIVKRFSGELNWWYEAIYTSDSSGSQATSFFKHYLACSKWCDDENCPSVGFPGILKRSREMVKSGINDYYNSLFVLSIITQRQSFLGIKLYTFY